MILKSIMYDLFQIFLTFIGIIAILIYMNKKKDDNNE